MPLTQPVQTQQDYLATNLIPVAIPSAANPCPICQEPYTPSSPPVLLAKCGHIFCRPCILAWFNSGLANANTCPMDRKILFPSTTTNSEDVADFHSASVLTPRFEGTARRVTASTRGREREMRPVVELLMGGEVIAVNSRLTRPGCERIVKDLWYLTARLLGSLERFCDEQVDALSLDVELLRGCIRDALPRGVRCEEGAWAVLYGVSRQMLVWHSEERRGNGWEGRGWVPVEELRGFAMGLYQACGGVFDW